MTANEEIDLKKIRIRRAREDDASELAQVEAACFSLPWSQKSLAESLIGTRSLYLTAEYEGCLIGECGVHFICGEGEISNVAVLPRFRSLGIARALLEELLKQSRQQGIYEFTLEVRAGNASAIRLYEGLGFQTEGIRRNFYEKPREDAIIMWKRQEMHGTITTEADGFSLYNIHV